MVKLCEYTSSNVVKIVSQSTTFYINVDKTGDIGQQVYVYQKEYLTTEGYVVNYRGEDTFMEYASRLGELVDKLSRTDLAILKDFLDNTVINLNVISTYDSVNSANNLITKSYIQSQGVGKFNCTPIEAVTGSASSFTFQHSTNPITSFIPDSERIMVNGNRTTQYTPDPNTGKIVFDWNISINDTLLADFNVLSSSTLEDLTFSAYTTTNTTGWITP